MVGCLSKELYEIEGDVVHVPIVFIYKGKAAVGSLIVQTDEELDALDMMKRFRAPVDLSGID